MRAPRLLSTHRHVRVETQVEQAVDDFLTTRKFDVFVVSYETLRIHASRFHVDGACDLLICDEAHRLKNDKTLTSQVQHSCALATAPPLYQR